MSAPNPDRAVAMATLLHLLESLTDTAIVSVQTARGQLASITFPPPPPAPRREDDRDCRADILTVLSESGRRFTTNQILTELDRRGWAYGERTVKVHLADMVVDGDVTKDPRAHPPGYGAAHD
jgi:hypothetical protein